MQSLSDSTRRFSNRVENYVKWRPSYPSAVVDILRANGRYDEAKTFLEQDCRQVQGHQRRDELAAEARGRQTG